MKKPKYIIGVDEAGRGPLAGPVAVGVTVVAADFDWALLPGVGDSKQVSEKNREAIFLRAKELKKLGQLDFHVSLIKASVIDKSGISAAVRQGIARGLKALGVDPSLVIIKLDGSLKAPEIYQNQETIVKGDAKEKVIGLASIMAKVTRDRYMVKVASQYPSYALGEHKGYGTAKHRAAIMKYGLSDLHRASFCRNLALEMAQNPQKVPKSSVCP